MAPNGKHTGLLSTMKPEANHHPKPAAPLSAYSPYRQGRIGMAVTAFCGLPSMTRSLYTR